MGFKKTRTVFCLSLSHEHLARDLADYTVSVCQIEPLVVALEHFYDEVHLLAQEWRSPLITGHRGEPKCLASPYG